MVATWTSQLGDLYSPCYSIGVLLNAKYRNDLHRNCHPAYAASQPLWCKHTLILCHQSAQEWTTVVAVSALIVVGKCAFSMHRVTPLASITQSQPDHGQTSVHGEPKFIEGQQPYGKQSRVAKHCQSMWALSSWVLWTFASICFCGGLCYEAESEVLGYRSNLRK